MGNSAKDISLSVNIFTIHLYKAIADSSEENVFFSPFSIAAALSMLYMGSKGNTELQIKTGVHLPESKNLIKNGFHTLLTDYKNKDVNYELRTSNMAYIQDKFPVVKEFIKTLKESFLSSVKNVDFAESTKIEKEINDVVEKETNSKIKNLIPSGTIDALTRLVLVNAIYFKGNWANKFDEKLTKPLPFWNTPTEKVLVDMMYQKNKFRLWQDFGQLDASVLAMDYEGSRLSFVILLPKERGGLSDLEKKLDILDFESLDLKTTSTEEVKVFLPKFKLEESVDLNPILQTLGMTDMFSEEKCDLSGISSEPGLHVSKVLHKAFLEVNEEGCEAAAATGICIELMCYVPTPDFVVDRPFLFFIQDNKTNQVLFIGRCVNPTNA